MNLNDLKDKVVVVTGASSGLGRQAALDYARQGSSLVLIARDEKALNDVKNEIENSGAKALIFPLDVTDIDALEAAAQKVEEEFGGIDIWVQAAAVSLYGEFDQISLQDTRRVMEVNFFGHLNALRIAMPRLERSSWGGRFMPILSILSRSSVPLQTAYVASKQALHGYYACVQEELEHRKSPVKVSMMFASSIDTPLTEHAKTYTGYRPKAVPPIYPVERYSKALLKATISPKLEYTVGGFGRVAVAMSSNFPKVVRKMQSSQGYKSQKTKEPRPLDHPNNLRSPLPDSNKIHGKDKPSKAINTAEEKGPKLVLGLAGLAALAFLFKKRKRA